MLYTTHDVILTFHLLIFVLCIVVMRSWSSRHENCPIEILIYYYITIIWPRLQRVIKIGNWPSDSKLEYSGILFGRERYQISEFQGHFALFDFCRQLFPVNSVCEARVFQSDKRFRLRQEITFKTLLCFPNIHVLPSALTVKHFLTKT